MGATKRIVIPKEFRVSNLQPKRVNIYYSEEEKLFFILFGKIASEEYLIGYRALDEKWRFNCPKEVFAHYKTTDVFLAQKDGRIYLFPM